MDPKWKSMVRCDCFLLSFLFLLSSTILLLAPFFLSLAHLNDTTPEPFSAPISATITTPVAETASTQTSTSISTPASTSSAAPSSTPLKSVSSSYNGYHSTFSFNLNRAYHPQWMFFLPDSTPLTSLSIPGSHNTMTNSLPSPPSQCQNHDLETQLIAGLRYFDIRARVVNNELLIYHEDSYTDHTYASVLLEFFKYLDMHPTETIVMRLKEESTPIDSSKDFAELFKHYIHDDPLTAAGCGAHFYRPSGRMSSIPTLGELRDKVLILQTFDASGENYGIPWFSPLLSIQDDWNIADMHNGLNEKWGAVQEGFRAAANGTESADGKLYLGHLSASVGVLPIEAAAGMKDGSVLGINDRTGNWLKDQDKNGTLGVVIVDFMGAKLVNGIVERNSHLHA